MQFTHMGCEYDGIIKVAMMILHHAIRYYLIDLFD